MNPIKGKNVYVEFMKGGSYVPFACCQQANISFTSTEISIQTVGDGIWEDTEVDTLGYTIDLTGLVPYDDDVNMGAFDLLQYLLQRVGVAFRMVFNKDDSTSYTTIEGIAGVRQWNIASATGFASGTINLKGKGSPTITNVADSCVITITEFDTIQQADHSVWQLTVQNVSGGTPIRYDYTFDGGAENTTFGNFFLSDVTIGTHTLKIWPVCSNGISGPAYTTFFTRST